MPDAALRRTVRRCTALLCLPLSLLPLVEISILLENGWSPARLPLQVGDEISLALFVLAAGYLLLSAVLQVLRWDERSGGTGIRSAAE